MRTDIAYWTAACLAFAGVARAEAAINSNTSEVIRDCYPRAWVRAEDLSPGRQVRAEARLKVDGEGCEGLVTKWQVGLRKKERAIFKFQ